MTRSSIRRCCTTTNNKYEITDIAHEKYPFLHRIRALRDVGAEVKAGDLGGFVESESNLSTAPEDNAWIYDDAIAAGDACVDLGSCLRGRAVVCDQAYVSQRAILTGEARAEDSSYVRGAAMAERARASGYSVIIPSPANRVAPVLNGNSAVYGTVMGDVRLTGNAVVLGDEKITNETQDTLVIDGATRSMLRDPSRDELAPNQRQPVQHKDKQKNRGGMSR